MSAHVPTEHKHANAIRAYYGCINDKVDDRKKVR